MSHTDTATAHDRAQLEAVAAEIGLTVTDEMDTNKKLKEAIESHHEEM